MTPGRVLLVTHTGRWDMVDLAREVGERCCRAGIAGPDARGRGGRRSASPTSRRCRRHERPRPAARSCWCSAATARSCARPSWPARPGAALLGVNLGRVGFLAETEPEAVEETVRHIVEREY